MSTSAAIGIATAALVAGLAVGFWLPPHGRLRTRNRPRPVRRILLPFTGRAISRRALEAAVRLAKAENAVIMPAFLARVPNTLPLDAPLPRQCAFGMPLMEAIEQRAASQGIDVDSRITRGRSYRDALRNLLNQEHFDRVIVSATTNSRTGLSGDDLKWLLERAPAEVLILRPAPDDTRRISAEGVSGHF
jgi:nucleotide-binding universal stress UspA family protein